MANTTIFFFCETQAASKEFMVPAALFVIYNTSTLVDFLECGLTVRAWWNNQRMNRIVCASSFLFSFLSAVSKFFGLSSTIFEVTKKDQNDSAESVDVGRFTFDSSSICVPGTALLLVHARFKISVSVSVSVTGHFCNFCSVSGISVISF